MVSYGTLKSLQMIMLQTHVLVCIEHWNQFGDGSAAGCTKRPLRLIHAHIKANVKADSRRQESDCKGDEIAL